MRWHTLSPSSMPFQTELIELENVKMHSLLLAIAGGLIAGSELTSVAPDSMVYRPSHIGLSDLKVSLAIDRTIERSNETGNTVQHGKSSSVAITIGAGNHGPVLKTDNSVMFTNSEYTSVTDSSKSGLRTTQGPYSLRASITGNIRNPDRTWGIRLCALPIRVYLKEKSSTRRLIADLILHPAKCIRPASQVDFRVEAAGLPATGLEDLENAQIDFQVGLPTIGRQSWPNTKVNEALDHMMESAIPVEILSGAAIRMAYVRVESPDGRTTKVADVRRLLNIPKAFVCLKEDNTELDYGMRLSFAPRDDRPTPEVLPPSGRLHAEFRCKIVDDWRSDSEISPLFVRYLPFALKSHVWVDENRTYQELKCFRTSKFLEIPPNRRFSVSRIIKRNDLNSDEYRLEIIITDKRWPITKDHVDAAYTASDVVPPTVDSKPWQGNILETVDVNELSDGPIPFAAATFQRWLFVRVTPLREDAAAGSLTLDVISEFLD